MTSWICPECGRECTVGEQGCKFCVIPPAAPPVQDVEEVAELASAAASSGIPPRPSACPHGLDLKLIQIVPAQFPNPPSLFIPRLPPTYRATTTTTATTQLEPVRQIVARQVRRPNMFPHWIAAAAVATIVLMAVASSVYRYIEAAKPKTIPASRPSPIAQTAADSDTENDYPFARFVEVSGLRVVDQRDHSQVQYVVINHSSTQLSDIGLRIAVRSGDMSRASSPIFSLSARVPRLGPNESKEMRVDLDSNLRTSRIPDWVNLRTDFKVVTP